MDFIKKHFEKLLLGIALLVLIGVAGFLAYRVTKLTEEVQEAPRLGRGKTKPNVTTTPTASYSNAIAGLQTPSLWRTNAIDPFQTEVKPIFETNTPIVVTNVFPLSLSRINRKQFELIFLSYKQPGDDFAINFRTRNKTFFIKKTGLEIKDAFEATGFFITKFERKTTNVFSKALNQTNEVDISELTIEKAGNPPIVLTLGKVAQEREPIAVINCDPINQESRLRKGDEITCAGKTYKVIDITPTQVLFEDAKSREKYPISLPGAEK